VTVVPLLPAITMETAFTNGQMAKWPLVVKLPLSDNYYSILTLVISSQKEREEEEAEARYKKIKL
jgi:hypothetical protein